MYLCMPKPRHKERGHLILTPSRIHEAVMSSRHPFVVTKLQFRVRTLDRADNRFNGYSGSTLARGYMLLTFLVSIFSRDPSDGNRERTSLVRDGYPKTVSHEDVARRRCERGIQEDRGRHGEGRSHLEWENVRVFASMGTSERRGATETAPSYRSRPFNMIRRQMNLTWFKRTVTRYIFHARRFAASR